jgi:DNA-binding XRE family transcriptional regulator
VRRQSAAATAFSHDVTHKNDCGVSSQSGVALETEKYDPSLPRAFKVARLFKTSIENIFSEDKPG